LQGDALEQLADAANNEGCEVKGAN
jgi:hypothetical protein